MKSLSLIGRIIFAIPFGIFGILHIVYGPKMAGTVPSFLPGGVLWIYLTGIGLVLGSLSIGLNKFVRISGPLLAFFLLSMILLVHLPGLGDPQRMQYAMSGLFKDLSLLGGTLLITYLFGFNKGLRNG